LEKATGRKKTNFGIEIKVTDEAAAVEAEVVGVDVAVVEEEDAAAVVEIGVQNVTGMTTTEKEMVPKDMKIKATKGTPEKATAAAHLKRRKQTIEMFSRNFILALLEEKKILFVKIL